MAIVYHPDADISKNEPVITFDEWWTDKNGREYPVLEATNEEPRPLGRYAEERMKYLQEYQPKKYQKMLLLGNMTEYLYEIQQQAEHRKETIIKQQMEAWGVTEELKANDQMQWVGLMNNIIHSAEEIVHQEIIYAD